MSRFDDLRACKEWRLRMKLGRAIQAAREAGIATHKLPVRAMEAALLSALITQEVEHGR